MDIIRVLYTYFHEIEGVDLRWPRANSPFHPVHDHFLTNFDPEHDPEGYEISPRDEDPPTRFNYHSDLSKRSPSRARYLPPIYFGNGLSSSTCLSESGAASTQRKSEDIASHGKLTFEEINILPQARRDNGVVDDDVDVRWENVDT
ncbi:hypothetical protein K0M31_004511 [Melipona bicolor]|uniref:Uncharacterized protein n=1 Tax=Melipona bicolor TaxID=60889 RepID=A0AA40KNM5_9HYME|nr:hypothetical protein K0M31_004511 [Melipona bicolor]